MRLAKKLLLIIFIIALSTSFTTYTDALSFKGSKTFKFGGKKSKKKKKSRKSKSKEKKAEKSQNEKKEEKVKFLPAPQIYTIMLKNLATVEDGLKMVVYLVEPTKANNTPKEIANLLVSKGVVDKDDVNNLNEPLTKGLLSDMILRAKGWGGGFMYGIFGGSRYAFRELVYRNIYPRENTSNYQHMSGAELIGTIDVSSLYDKKE